MESVFTFISEHYPIIGIMLVVAIVVYYGTKYHIDIQNMRHNLNNLSCKDHKDTPVDIQNIKQTLNNLPCEDHKNMIVSIAGDLKYLRESTDSIKDSMDSLKEIVVEICEWVVKKDKNMASSILRKLSPYKLTEAGEQFLVLSGGKACIDENLDFFISELGNIKPNTALDVENGSHRVLVTNLGNPIFKAIKDYVFMAPEEIQINGDTIQVSLTTVLIATSIYLRDKYLDLHPYLIPEDVKNIH